MQVENHMHLLGHVVQGKCHGAVGHMLDMFAMGVSQKLLNNMVTVALVLSVETKDDSFWTVCGVHVEHKTLGLYCYDQEMGVEVVFAFLAVM
jgi:hypothetical protein